MKLSPLLVLMLCKLTSSFSLRSSASIVCSKRSLRFFSTNSDGFDDFFSSNAVEGRKESKPIRSDEDKFGSAGKIKQDRDTPSKAFNNDKAPFKRNSDGGGDRGGSSFKRYEGGDRGSSFKRYEGGDRGGSSFKRYEGGDRGGSSFKRYEGGDRGGNSFKRSEGGESENRSFKRNEGGDGEGKPFKRYESRERGEGNSFKRYEGGDRGGSTFKRYEGGDRSFQRYGSDGPRRRWNSDEEEEKKEPPVYGYYTGDHLYGVAPVRLALLANRRKFGELIMQTDMSLEDKKDSSASLEILELCKSKDIPVRYFPKHDLNMLADNRPHQGFILRCQPLDFVPLKTLEPVEQFKVVLALDEVADPQNFGALLRTSHFLGVDKVVVCAKNSAPLSPVVSKASAGALELMAVHYTDNLMRFLDASKENGWQVVGTDLSDKAVPLTQLPLTAPTVLVLGNEGHGIRTNILRRCDHLVKISKIVSTEGVEGTEEGVDSLNVSVSGGILLHHLVSARASTSSATPTATPTDGQ